MFMSFGFVIERMTFWIQAAEISLICRVTRVILRDRVGSSDNQWGLGVELPPLHIQGSQLSLTNRAFD